MCDVHAVPRRQVTEDAPVVVAAVKGPAVGRGRAQRAGARAQQRVARVLLVGAARGAPSHRVLQRCARRRRRRNSRFGVKGGQGAPAAHRRVLLQGVAAQASGKPGRRRAGRPRAQLCRQERGRAGGQARGAGAAAAAAAGARAATGGVVDGVGEGWGAAEAENSAVSPGDEVYLLRKSGRETGKNSATVLPQAPEENARRSETPLAPNPEFLAHFFLRSTSSVSLRLRLPGGCKFSMATVINASSNGTTVTSIGGNAGSAYALQAPPRRHPNLHRCFVPTTRLAQRLL